MRNFNSVGEIICEAAALLRPPERLTVTQAAMKYRYVNQPGAYVGQWLNSTTPYMMQPTNTFTSPIYSGLVFVGPAQSGKTDSLVINTLAYCVKVDPMDMMLVCPTMVDARDFSMRRVDRLHRHSESVGEMLLPGADSDNVFDKHYSSGMLFTLAWPTPSQLAGKPIGRIIMTDRDRMEDDVGGDGEPFDLASKRTTTFGSYAMTVAESSPSREITNLKWIARTPHEAPPCEGIMALYNRGDKRRWYWPCPECGTYFEGRFEMLELDPEVHGSNLERANTVRMRCPHCAALIHPDQRNDMQSWGVWVKDGQGVMNDGTVFGPETRSMIASFWLRGVAAAFMSWRKLYATFMDANDTYLQNGSEESLKKFYNNDLGEPYTPKSANDLRLPEVLKARAEKLEERHVPAGVRFLIGTVDVQKTSFQVCIFGILPGAPFDLVIVDRFAIEKSHRLDHDNEHHRVKPHTYGEDWDLITELVLDVEYPLADRSGRMMGMKFVGCDSGGKEGVTTKAYEYYRRLRDQNKHRRFILVKGEGLPNQPRTRISYPDASKKDIKAVARGDVPILLLNSNVLKDDLDGRLDCIQPGKGMYRFPDWMSDSVYNELCVETRGPKGWENLSNARNEQTDLSYYCIGLCVSELLRIEHMSWENAPGWAGEWDVNDLVRTPEMEKRFANSIKSGYDFSSFAKELA